MWTGQLRRCLLHVNVFDTSTVNDSSAPSSTCGTFSRYLRFCACARATDITTYLMQISLQVMRRARASVGQEDLAQYVKWTAEFGQEG